jgi:hypothetical protein
VEGEQREADTAPLVRWDRVERQRGMCAPGSFMPKPERKETERGEDPARAQGRKEEEGWGPGSGRHVEGRRAWGVRLGWAAVGSLPWAGPKRTVPFCN